MTATILEREETTVREFETSDEPEQSAHIVLVPPHEDDQTPQAYVLRARIEGFAIEALCGHVFVPQRNPEPLPTCSGCLEIYQFDPYGKGDRGELPNA